jgi:hypothetical protein
MYAATRRLSLVSPDWLYPAYRTFIWALGVRKLPAGLSGGGEEVSKQKGPTARVDYDFCMTRNMIISSQ